MNLHQADSTFQQRFGGYQGFWCVAGGWALDLYLGRQTREHEDLEVVVLRCDFADLYPHTHPWQPQKIFSGDPPRFVPWTGDGIEPEVIQMRLDPADGCEFDVLLTPSEGADWICRRDETIRRPLSEAAIMLKSKTPVLASEIVLLFKAKYLRPKDQKDFDHTFPFLTPEAKAWLSRCLSQIHPEHPWIQLCT